MKYQDIIDYPFYELKYNKRRPRENRACQFAPFASLQGYYDLIRENGRVFDKRIELTEERRYLLDLNVDEAVEKQLQVSITYFVSVRSKNIGKYKRCVGTIRKIDKIKKEIIMDNKMIISIWDILDIKFL